MIFKITETICTYKNQHKELQVARTITVTNIINF